MATSDVIFSVMDKRTGPVPVFSTKKEDDLFCKKVAFKSQMTLSMMSSDTIYTTDAILPFPDINKNAYVFIFGIYLEDRTETVATLSYIISSSEQMNLYKKVPILRKQAESIAEVLKTSYHYSGEFKLSGELEKLLRSFGTEESLNVQFQTLEEQLKPRKITLHQIGSESGSIKFLLETFKNGIESILYSLLINEPIIIIGNQAVIPVVISSIEQLVQFRTLQKVAYTTEFIDPSNADLIGIPPQLEGEYKDKNVIIINLEKKTIIGQERSKYFKELIKTLTLIDDEVLIQQTLVKKLNEILNYSQELIELCTSPVVNENDLKRFKKRFSPELADLIIKIAKIYSPSVKCHITEVDLFGKIIDSEKAKQLFS